MRLDVPSNPNPCPLLIDSKKTQMGLGAGLNLILIIELQTQEKSSEWLPYLYFPLFFVDIDSVEVKIFPSCGGLLFTSLEGG